MKIKDLKQYLADKDDDMDIRILTSTVFGKYEAEIKGFHDVQLFDRAGNKNAEGMYGCNAITPQKKKGYILIEI